MIYYSSCLVFTQISLIDTRIIMGRGNGQGHSMSIHRPDGTNSDDNGDTCANNLI